MTCIISDRIGEWRSKSFRMLGLHTPPLPKNEQETTNLSRSLSIVIQSETYGQLLSSVFTSLWRDNMS